MLETQLILEEVEELILEALDRDYLVLKGFEKS